MEAGKVQGEMRLGEILHDLEELTWELRDRNAEIDVNEISDTLADVSLQTDSRAMDIYIAQQAGSARVVDDEVEFGEVRLEDLKELVHKLVSGDYLTRIRKTRILRRCYVELKVAVGDSVYVGLG